MNKKKRARVVLHPTLGDQLYTWHSYQRYYAMGLGMLEDVHFRYGSMLDGALAAARDRGWRGVNTVWKYAARHPANERTVRATHVGRYTFELADQSLRVAVDSHDKRDICDPDALSWSQLYFKASYWPKLDYGPKVRPLVCGNGQLTRQRIARLIAMRNRSRDLDLVFIAKLWPSNPAVPTYWNPVEHLVRVFETLAKLKIRSYLRAIPVELMDGGQFPRHYLARLVKAGVQVTATDVTADELWDVTSRAELAFLRPGKHLCVSWRMIDHLALGSATVCDHAAYPQWPVPLQVGRELLDCDCGIGVDESLPDPADYGRIADTVMTSLADPERVATVRRAAAAYFDQHVAPDRIARYLLDVASSVAQSQSRLLELTPATASSAAPEASILLNAQRHG
jgi:hypothetical protein